MAKLKEYWVVDTHETMDVGAIAKKVTTNCPQAAAELVVGKESEGIDDDGGYFTVLFRDGSVLVLPC